MPLLESTSGRLKGEMHDVAQVAVRYSVSIPTVISWINEGSLKAINVGSRPQQEKNALADLQSSH
jgi:hypothetical protein